MSSRYAFIHLSFSTHEMRETVALRPFCTLYSVCCGCVVESVFCSSLAAALVRFVGLARSSVYRYFKDRSLEITWSGEPFCFFNLGLCTS